MIKQGIQQHIGAIAALVVAGFCVFYGMPGCDTAPRLPAPALHHRPSAPSPDRPAPALPDPQVVGGSYIRFRLPYCEACGTSNNVQGHHVVPQSQILAQLAAGKITAAQAEHLINDDPNNIVSLCRQHHWLYGHCAHTWGTENIYVVDMIKAARASLVTIPAYAREGVNKHAE